MMALTLECYIEYKVSVPGQQSQNRTASVASYETSSRDPVLFLRLLSGHFYLGARCWIFASVVRAGEIIIAVDDVG
jgi:hypothetical protein